MRIRQITIQKLFGTFDHIIPLNMTDRITILHGLNGFGKTTILRMLDNLFNGSLLLLFEVPFEKFVVTFDDGRAVEIEQIDRFMDESSEYPRIQFALRSDSRVMLPPLLEKQHLTSLISQNLESTQSRFRLHSQDEWIDRRNGQKLKFSELLALPELRGMQPEDLLRETPSWRPIPEWLLEMRKQVSVQVIETERLQTAQVASRFSSGSSETLTIVRTVMHYSAQLAAEMNATLARYGEKSQSLDRTFPARLVSQKSDTTLPLDQLQEKLRALEVRRSKLVEIGLLGKEHEKGLITSDQIDPAQQSVLTIYVHDMEAKFQVFDALQSRLELFVKLIHDRFRYKKLQIDRDEGFRFVSDSGKVLPPSALSSGEQHELVILYMLLFKVRPNTLILMDEPELSLHVGWQVQFIEDMQALIKLTGFDLLLATHSPQIVNDRWDLTVELKGP